MRRLVTKSDLQANPELSKKGVSVNQSYDFPDEPVNKKGKKALTGSTKNARN